MKAICDINGDSVEVEQIGSEFELRIAESSSNVEGIAGVRGSAQQMESLAKLILAAVHKAA